MNKKDAMIIDKTHVLPYDKGNTMRWLLLSLMMTLSLIGDEDLGEIQIEGTAPTEDGFSEVFTLPEYIEQRSYMPNAAGQKRMTTQEAMFIPGVQGDPLKGLKSLGGVTALSDMTGELYIYGSKPQESQYSINHLPIGYVFHGFGIHSVISPDAIDQIDAYLGGFDTTYGDAMGGIIDITPRYPTGSDSGFGHIGIYDASAGVDVALSNDVSLYVGARRSYYDLLLQAVGETTGTLSEEDNVTYTQFPNYWDITALLDYRFDDSNAFSVEMLTAKDDLTIQTYNNIEKDPLATGNIDNDSGFFSAGARHRYEGSEQSTNTLLYYNKSYYNTELFTDYFFKFESQRYGLFHQNDIQLDDHLFTFGVEFEHLDLPLDFYLSRPPSPNDPDFDFTTEEKFRVDETIRIDTRVLFWQDTWQVNDDLTLRYGIRYSNTDYQEFQGLIDPRVSAVYQLGYDDSISASIGLYSQIPEGFQTQEDLGSTTLSFERSAHFMFSYDHVDANAQWSISPFYKRFDDLAIDVLDANGSTDTYASSGKGDAYGIDLSAKYRNGRYYAFAAYTYLRAKRQVDTSDPTKYPFYGDIPHTLQLMGSVRFLDNWAFSVLTKYASGKPYTPIVGTYEDPADSRVRPVYGDLFSERLPDYFTLNLKLAQEIAMKDGSSLTWSFELMNATNHENVSEIRYDDDYRQEGYITQLPLLPWFDVTYRF